MAFCGSFSMKYLKLYAFAALILTLPACANVEQTVTDAYYSIREMGVSDVSDSVQGKPLSQRLVDKGACPAVEIVEDLDMFYDFGGQPPSTNNLVSSAALSQQNACAYGPKSVTVDIRLAFSGAIGPGGRAQSQDEPFFSYPYFVAIMGPGGAILAKEVFAVSLTYPPGANQETHLENLRQIIPIRNQESGASHKVVVGFQLTNEQLAYNRAVIEQRKKMQAAKDLAARQAYTRAQAQKQRQTSAAPPMNAAAPAAGDPLDTGPIVIAPQEDPNKLNQ
jgi:hypothetical protein